MAETTVKERRSGELAGNLDTSFLKVLALCLSLIHISEPTRRS